MRTWGGGVLVSHRPSRATPAFYYTYVRIRSTWWTGTVLGVGGPNLAAQVGGAVRPDGLVSGTAALAVTPAGRIEPGIPYTCAVPPTPAHTQCRAHTCGLQSYPPHFHSTSTQTNIAHTESHMLMYARDEWSGWGISSTRPRTRVPPRCRVGGPMCQELGSAHVMQIPVKLQTYLVVHAVASLGRTQPTTQAAWQSLRSHASP